MDNNFSKPENPAQRPAQNSAGPNAVRPQQGQVAQGQGARPMQNRPAGDNHSIPPVQRQYPADAKIGSNMAGGRPVAGHAGPQPQNATRQPTQPVSGQQEQRNFSSSVAATVASVSKAAEGMGLDENIVERFKIPEKYLKVKSVLLLLSVCLLIGVVLGYIFFSGGDKHKNEQFTIGYIVVNPEVPPKRGRCGAAESSSGCILYVQNNQRRERDARDFYPLIEQMTGINRFQIETANMRYAHRSIKPGYIAQFYIPPIK